MEELLVILIQFIFEVIVNLLIDVVSYLPLDAKSYRSDDDTAPAWGNFWLFIVGSLIGALTLIVFQYAFIKIPALRIANLFLLPLLSALLFEWRAKERAEMNPRIIPRRHFWRAFWFTLGFTAVRFAFTGQWGESCKLEQDLYFHCPHY